MKYYTILVETDIFYTLGRWRDRKMAQAKQAQLFVLFPELEGRLTIIEQKNIRSTVKQFEQERNSIRRVS